MKIDVEFYGSIGRAFALFVFQVEMVIRIRFETLSNLTTFGKICGLKSALKFKQLNYSEISLLYRG